ncbi:hypothetical protein C453_15833 [Haloferax elongans ATCC BAA-1513]|uniref:Uncharacterized protein n=1 Tax=Haloferax elongans ATCC BAA-1513 TaxID=1230453 RepID=M0HDK9_HALEO|nr:hypothetical protein [Haloferax elongans]ELZ82570.1 hypothetical protein C453_15833 [Haloferax elongans ATCC BAA-1513]
MMCQKIILARDETLAVLAFLDPTARNARRLAFGLLTILLGAMTVWSFLRGQAVIRVILLASLTAYAGSNLLSQRIPHISRIAAVPLGVIGVGAYILGAPTDLPILLILLGIGSVVDLVWDPTGNVYGSDSK